MNWNKLIHRRFGMYKREILDPTEFSPLAIAHVEKAFLFGMLAGARDMDAPGMARAVNKRLDKVWTKSGDK